MASRSGFSIPFFTQFLSKVVDPARTKLTHMHVLYQAKGNETSYNHMQFKSSKINNGGIAKQINCIFFRQFGKV